jgi:hypothetical protein
MYCAGRVLVPCTPGCKAHITKYLLAVLQVKMCTRSTPHNWKLCPWAHPGEAAARRHPSCHQADLCHAVRMVSKPRRCCSLIHHVVPW